jgi:hypothetical protein
VLSVLLISRKKHLQPVTVASEGNGVPGRWTSVLLVIYSYSFALAALLPNLACQKGARLERIGIIPDVRHYILLFAAPTSAMWFASSDPLRSDPLRSNPRRSYNVTLPKLV